MASSLRFLENVKVLCFHGPLIYEAKVQKVPEARILKYSETNLDKLRALKREHETNARATKAAAAKRKQEQLEAAKSIRDELVKKAEAERASLAASGEPDPKRPRTESSSGENAESAAAAG